MGSDGVTEFHASVEVNVEFFALALEGDIDAKVHVVANGHVKVHVSADELVLIVEVFGVEHVNGQHVLGFGDDVDIKSGGFAAKGRLRPVCHDDGVGK